MFSLISVLNYQDRESLENLLFASTKDVEAQKILVDDNSGIEDVKKLAESYNWTYIKNETNFGLAASINRGIVNSGNEKIVIVDPDTYCPSGTLEELAAELDNQKTGIVGPQLNEKHSWTYQYNKHAPTLDDFKNNSEVFEEYAKQIKSQFGDKTKKARVSGSVMGFRKEIWYEVGGFDATLKEGFFEDTDFVSKAKKQNYYSVLKKGVFMHHGGYKGQSRTIFQGLAQGKKMLQNALHNTKEYASRHGHFHTMYHIVNGLISSATGWNTISREVAKNE